MGLLQTVVRCGAVGFRVLSTRERVGYIALLWRLVEGNEARIGGDLRVCHCGAFEFEGVAEKEACLVACFQNSFLFSKQQNMFSHYS